jgi:hypothetical protein
MISKELADPFGLFFKYLKNFFSTIILSPLIYNGSTFPHEKKAPLLGLKIGGLWEQTQRLPAAVRSAYPIRGVRAERALESFSTFCKNPKTESTELPKTRGEFHGQESGIR